jgi:polyhydroxyalkanoate synthesis repressor PhaR
MPAREGHGHVAEKQGSDEPIVIKKYANRRLYNTATSSYVTLDHLSQMVKRGEDFVVHDAKTGEEITRSVLTQIIFEEEGKGQNLLPIQFLRQLIRFYGDQVETLVPRYLELSMDAFTRNQETLREKMNQALGASAQPLKIYEEMARQNVALFQEAWVDAYRRMTNFGGLAGSAGGDRKPGNDQDAARGGNDIDELKAQLAALQKRLDDIAGGKK